MSKGKNQIATIISSHKQELVTLFKKYNVTNCFVFGSASDEAKWNDETSDIDLIISISSDDPVQKGLNLLTLWDALEKLFKRKVDLISQENISNPYLRESIDETKQLLYVA